MYYDDGYEELLEEEKAKLAEAENDPTRVRAYHLTNGTVFGINNKMIEFKDGIFYEVIQTRAFYNPKYERTGKTFTVEELNILNKI